MIGLIMLGLGLTGIAVVGVKNAKQTYTNFRDAKQSGMDSYFDAQNHLHNIQNGRTVIQTKLNNGHWVMEDVETGQIYHDYTQKRINSEDEKWRQKAIKNGENAYLRSLTDAEVRSRGLGLGKSRVFNEGRFYYFDVVTDQIYVYQHGIYPCVDENGNNIKVSVDEYHASHGDMCGCSFLTDPYTGMIVKPYKKADDIPLIRNIIAFQNEKRRKQYEQQDE